MSHGRSALARRRLTLAEIRKHDSPLVSIATLGLLALLLALALPVQRANAASRTLVESYELKGADRLEFGVPFGDLKIEGVDGGPVRVRVEATCDRDRHCDEYLDGMRLEANHRGKALRVKLRLEKMHAGLGLGNDHEDDEGDENGTDWSEHGDHLQSRGHDSNIRIVVQVPRSLSVELNVGAGEVDIQGLREDLWVDMGAGEVNVRMRERLVREVQVNLAVGEAMIRQGGRTREYARVLGGPIRWSEGRGRAGIEVNLGAGEVDVTLD